MKPKSRRKYLNFTTPVGVDLSRVARTGWTPFLIHESGYLSKLQNWNHEGVDSPFWRFYYNPKAGCHLGFEGEAFPLDSDHAILIPADTVFDCCAGSSIASHFWIHFSVCRPGEPLPLQPIRLPLDAVMRSLIQTLIASHAEPAGEERYHRIYHLSASLLHLAFGRLPAPPVTTLPDRLLEVLALVQRAPHSDLSNPFLAAFAGMSVEGFIRSFREHIGQTPAAYVTDCRVRIAAEQLALTDKSIEQVAAACGFPNRHYFSRVFSRQLSCGPAEFRKRQRERRGI